MNRWNMFKPKLLKAIVPIPLKASHVELSAIASMEDEPATPSAWLLEVSLKAVEEAAKIRLDELSSRLKGPPYYPNIWPGEHYRLLAGFVKVLAPMTVVEIGTFRGIGTLALKEFLPKGARLVTYDPVTWDAIPSAVLNHKDFDDVLSQSMDDLAVYSVVEKNADLLKAADMIFVDAAKDGVMEKHFIDNLGRIGLKENTLVIFDDIRLWNMLQIWRSIELPKLDMTSFGHWSGTGVVHWNPSYP